MCRITTKVQEKPRVVEGTPVTGLRVSSLGADRQIIRIMKASGIPGVARGDAKSNDQVLTRGYGKANSLGHAAVEPTTIGGWMFR
jgi:hypothetical protein